MINISRKKFDGEMKLTTTRAPTHITIKELRDELNLSKILLTTGKKNQTEGPLV